MVVSLISWSSSSSSSTGRRFQGHTICGCITSINAKLARHVGHGVCGARLPGSSVYRQSAHCRYCFTSANSRRARLTKSDAEEEVTAPTRYVDLLTTTKRPGAYSESATLAPCCGLSSVVGTY